MAARDRRSYVYIIRDGHSVLYVGKGTGRRAKESARKHGGEAVIAEWFDDESKAFARERELIAELLPLNNISPGGNGGRSKPKAESPEARRNRKEFERFEREYHEVGPRRYVARFLLSRFANQIAPSKLEMVRQVAHGGWA